MTIEYRMAELAMALPEYNSIGRLTVRDVCLTLHADGWQALAGGHPAVHIGEFGGEFQGHGETAEEAIAECLKNIKKGAHA